VFLPLAGCVVCFTVAYLVPPFVTFVLTIVAMMLFFDGALALLPTGDGLWSNRQ
jgi:positive regulator of sigma E activity